MGQFYIFLSGSSRETYEGKTRECQPSAVYYHPAGVAHSTHFHPAGTREFSLFLDQRWMSRIKDHLDLSDAPREFLGTPVHQLMLKLYQELYQEDALFPVAIEGLVLEILSEVARSNLRQSQPMPSRRALQARDMIHDRFMHPLSLGEIAEALDIHPTHLARVFRQRYHCTVGDYIRALRIEFAQLRLSTTDDPLSHIALDAGFSDQSHFSKSFKRHTGITPAQYRQSLQRR
jgi:AraC family transcriptional regulator